MPNESDQIFSKLLSEIYREIMKPKGWKREGQNYRLIQKNGILSKGMIVSFQKSQWNSTEELRFTINAARKIVLGVEIDPKFKEYECHFTDRKRPQNLSTKYTRDQWWCITAQTDYLSLKAEISEYLESYALPWLTGSSEQQRSETHTSQALQIGKWYTQYSAGYWQLLAVYPKYADEDYSGEKVHWKKGDRLGDWAVLKKAFTGKMKKSIRVEFVDSSYLKAVPDQVEAEINAFFAANPDYLEKFRSYGDQPDPAVTPGWANFTPAEAKKKQEILSSLPAEFTVEEFRSYIGELRHCFGDPPETHIVYLYSYPWHLTEQYDLIFSGAHMEPV